jgi:RHS repeat-associated protein
VSNWSPGGWVLASSTLFLYDGWNLIAELNALSANSVTRSYVWGLDLSGSFQGAGGVGGLLFASSPAPSSMLHAPCFDGNGNVIALVDMSTGAKSATYEYNAFGETIISEGVAAANPFRFSTKYTDSETSLIYYGLRYYNAVAGRWVNRDPRGERGGINLMAAMRNDLLSRIDPLGLNEEDGHYYTTHDIAKANAPRDSLGGLLPGASSDAEEIAYYSQYPDEVSAYDARSAGLRMLAQVFSVFDDAFDRDIQNYLHSLHGGGPDAVKKRQCCLQRLVKNSKTNWEKGLLIHALADSYAHVDGKGNAYSTGLGHTYDSRSDKTDPDIIANEGAQFKSYTAALNSALGGKMSNAELSALQNAKLQSYPNQQQAINAARSMSQIVYGYKGTYDPRGSSKSGEKVIDPLMGELTKAQVQSVIDKIKRACN